MRATTVFKSVLAALMAASLMVAGHTWADDDDGGGRGGGRGGDRGGGGSSFSRGDGGSSRSFSGGSSRSGSSRSGDSSRSFSRGDGGGSSRSFSGSSERSSRSFNGGSSRSFSDGGGSSRQYARPSDSGNRSFSRGSDQGSSHQFRSYQSGQDGERSTFSPSNRGSYRSDQFGNRSDENRSAMRDPSSDGQRGSFNQGGQQYQSRRPSEEQVRDFLQMRGDREGQRTDVARRNEFSRGDDGDRSFSDRGERSVNDQFRDRERDFDRDRDVNRDGSGDFANRERDGREGDLNYQRWREGARGRDGDDDDHRDWSGKWRDGNRFASANRIRDDWRHRDRDDYPFHGRWWDDDDHWHGAHWNWWGGYAHRYNRPYYWWAWATAPRLTSWVSFGWNRPYYWDYGPGEYIYYDDGIVYVNGRWYAPGPVFYDRTVQIVERAPDLTPDEAAELEWMPLGVFAITRDGQADAEVLVQLAVTKDGVIGGTANDQRTGAAYPVEGTVEKQTQRAVWSYTNDRNRRVVMETSIFNLTQAESTGLVHYGPNDMQVVEIVRLEQPDANAATSAAGELPAP